MSKLINIAVVGLGQVGNYLLNELITKKKDLDSAYLLGVLPKQHTQVIVQVGWCQ